MFAQVYCCHLCLNLSAAPSQLQLCLQFKALLKTGLVEDMLFLYDSKNSEAHLVILLGRDVCGHEKIVHGGLTSSICDETYGALVYAMKQADLLGAGIAVTANLSVNFRKVTTAYVMHCASLIECTIYRAVRALGFISIGAALCQLKVLISVNGNVKGDRLLHRLTFVVMR